MADNDFYKKADDLIPFRNISTPVDLDPKRTLGITDDRDAERARQVARAAGAYRKTSRKSTRR